MFTSSLANRQSQPLFRKQQDTAQKKKYRACDSELLAQLFDHLLQALVILESSKPVILQPFKPVVIERPDTRRMPLDSQMMSMKRSMETEQGCGEVGNVTQSMC